MTETDEDSVPPSRALPPLLPWQGNAAREALSRRATWPHGLLIQGRPGIGKGALALHFAQSLLCESPQGSGLACGSCASCRYVAAGQHPDLRLVEPSEIDDDGEIKLLADIPIGHIRALIEFTQITSHRRRAKVALIVPADRMNVNAANALLKTLEEPPADTYLVLVTAQPGRIAATVRSRCRVFDAPVPTPAQAREWLGSHGVGSPDSVLAQAGGAPLAALALADPGVQAERTHWLAALARPEALSPLALGARVESAGREERRDRLAAAIEWLLGWTADLARVSSGGAPTRNPDFAAALASLSTRVARVSLLRYHRRLLRQRTWIHHPLQPRLVVEALLIDYRALFN
jgi:DNA polymerase-3 subunit delta'